MRELDSFLAEKFNITESSAANYRLAFRKLGELTDHPFSLSKDEMVNCLQRLSQTCAPRTFNLYVTLFKSFYRWKTGDKTFMDWVKLKPASRLEYVQTKILSEAEVQAILRACTSPRDKALFAVAAATGLRRSTLMDLHIRDLVVRPYGYDLVSARGKTITVQPPPVVKEFSKILRVWLENHPSRDNPDSPLWARIKGDEVKAITGIHAADVLRRTAKRAGIKRRVHFHMFRHSAATWFAKRKLTEAELRLMFGWSEDSRTPSVYVHLTNDDAKRAGLRAYGIVQAEDEGKSEFETVRCGYCGEENAPVNKYCSMCGLVLDAEEAAKQVAMQKAFEKLTGSRGALENILKRVEELEKRLGNKDGS